MQDLDFRVAVDFDGTLVEQTIFPTFDYKLKSNAEKVLRRMNKKGVKFILNTARYTWYRLPAIFFILKKKLPIKIQWFNRKPQANLFIDDGNIFCENIDWLKIEQEILKQFEGSKKCTK